MFFNKPLSEITESDLESLVENQIPEGKTLEYKLELWKWDDAGKNEFCKDLSSFANTAGGDIIIGIREENDVAKKIEGLQIDLESERLHLEQVKNTRISPRLPNYETHIVSLKDDKKILIIRVRKSWLAPHGVEKNNKSYTFYGRHSNGVFSMDIDEIRTAIALSESIEDRIKNFRIDRLLKIMGDETPIPCKEGPKLVLYLIPLSAFTTRNVYDVRHLRDPRKGQVLQPLGTPSQRSARVNIDGVISYCSESPKTKSYVQIYRKGIMEAVYSIIGDSGTILYDYGRPFNGMPLFKKITEYLNFLKDLGVETPIYLFVSFVGVNGYKIFLPQDSFSDSPKESDPADRDVLNCSEVLIESYDDTSDETSQRILKPILDEAWNAFGFPECPYYDEAGNWGAR